MSGPIPTGPSSGGQPEQVVCPNCKGGNPVGATNCMWCGAALNAPLAPPPMPPQYQQPTQPQQPQGSYPLPPQYQQVSPVYTPQSSYPQQTSPYGRKRPVWLIVLLVLLGLCVCGGVSAVLIAQSIGTSVNSTVTEIGTSIASDLPSPTEGATGGNSSNGATSGLVLPVGSTGESDGLKVTLNSIRHETSGNLPPAAASEYIIADMTFENTSSTEQNVASLIDMSITDSAGNKYAIAFGADTKGSADGTLAAGAKANGETAFEVPTDATGLTLIYDPLIGGQQVRFKLDR